MGIARNSKGGHANMAAFSQGRGKKVKIEKDRKEQLLAENMD